MKKLLSIVMIFGLVCTMGFTVTGCKDPAPAVKKDPKADPKADPKTDPKADPKADPKTDPKADPKKN